MFGPRGVKRCLGLRAQAQGLPPVAVTAEEFVAALVATGVTEDDARSHAAVASILNSSVLVGDRILKIKRQP